MYPYIVLLHILTATISVGGHLIMISTYLPESLQKKDPKILLTFIKKFGIIGNPSLILLILTGLYLGYEMLPNLSDLFSFKNHLDTLVSIKLILLLLLGMLIANIKMHLVPRVKKNDKYLNVLALNIILLTFIAILFVITGLSFRFSIF